MHLAYLVISVYHSFSSLILIVELGIIYYYSHFQIMKLRTRAWINLPLPSPRSQSTGLEPDSSWIYLTWKQCSFPPHPFIIPVSFSSCSWFRKNGMSPLNSREGLRKRLNSVWQLADYGCYLGQCHITPVTKLPRRLVVWNLGVLLVCLVASRDYPAWPILQHISSLWALEKNVVRGKGVGSQEWGTTREESCIR